MKLTKTTTGNTQNICLCKLATDPRFVTEVGSQMSLDIWEDDWSRILFQMITDYTRAYNDSVLPVLPRLAKDKSSSIHDEDTAEAVIRYASHLADFYDDHQDLFKNEKFLRDTILRWIKERNLVVLQRKLEDALDSGNLEDAEGALHAYSEVKQVEIVATDLMHDANKIIAAYSEDKGDLLKLPGALGDMIGPLSRGDDMLVLGESGTGKSFVSLQIAYDAVKKGLSVLYVNCENTDRQMIRRIYSNMSGCAKEDKTVDFPYFSPFQKEYSSDDGEAKVVTWNIAYKKKELKGPDLDKNSVDTFLKNRRLDSNGGQFMLMSFAPKELTVRGLEHELDNLRDYKNFIPDVLIVDYGDLMRPENSREDKRTQIDSIYLGLRSIALGRDLLLISPVQSNRAGYGRDVSKANMAENIGNVNHASVIIGLNHTPEEKEKGITRIKILKNRDGKEASEPIVCLGCLEIGRPIIQSKWMHEVHYVSKDEDEEE